MIQIIGSGMGPSDLSRLDIDFATYDTVVCDKSYTADIDHPHIVQFGYSDTQKYLLENGHQEKIAYVVSGSPFFYSGATSLSAGLKEAGINYDVLPGISSKDYLIQKLSIPEQEVCFTSLHGRSELDMTNFMVKRYTFLLCDEQTPERLRSILHYLNDEDYTLTLGSRFGFEKERIERVEIEEFVQSDLKALMPFVLLIEKKYEDKPSITSDEDLEAQRGMYTKPYKRHLILQMLELKTNQILWDIGAGSGSVSLDAFKTYRVHTVLFEKNPERTPIIRQNLSEHHILSTRIYEGLAEDDMEIEQSVPDRIFVGGGGENITRNLEKLIEKLNKGGILVAAYVSLEHLSLAIQVLDSSGKAYEVKSLSLTSYKQKLKISEPERQMFLIRVVK